MNPVDYRSTILPRILKWIELIMSEHLFTFSNGFQKRSSSTPQSSITRKSTACFLILTRSGFYGIMLSSCSRIKFIIWIKLNTAIFISALKQKVCSSYLKKEKLSRRIKSQKLRIQNTIFLEWLTLGNIKINSLNRIKITIRLMKTLVIIKIRSRSAPTTDGIFTSQLDD